jgi:hypothetical protein
LDQDSLGWVAKSQQARSRKWQRGQSNHRKWSRALRPGPTASLYVNAYIFSKVSKRQQDRTVVNRSTKILREIRMAETHFQLAERTLGWNSLQTLDLKCWSFFLLRP